MLEFFRAIFGTDFMPHLYCLRSDPGVLWLQVVSDMGIAVAYFAIPLVLLEVVRKRRDIIFRWVAVLFVFFIAACGTTHLLAVWTIWIPMYRLEAVAKAATAALSIITALTLVRLRPLLLKLPSIAELEAEIRERRRAEEIVIEREERLQNFVDSVEDYAIYLIGPEGNVETWNHGAERMKGYTAEEIVGQNIALFYSAEDRAQGRPEAALREAREAGVFKWEGSHVRKDGTRFMANVTMRPLYDGKGVLRGFSKVTRDITESRELEARFQVLLEAAPDAFLIVNREGLIEFINAQGEKIFGYAREEVLGKSVDIFNPERVREMQAVYRDQLFSGSGRAEGGSDTDLWGLRKDGTEFPLEFTLSPLDTKDGRVFLFALRDITERKKTEARFQALLESAPDAMVIVNRKGLIELANRQTEELFGYSRLELVGQSVDILVPDALREGHAGHRDSFFASPKPRQMGAELELQARRKDGTQFPVEISLSPLKGPDGVSVTAAIRDVTDRKKAETRFRALLESAPDAMVIVNSDGLIELANTQSERLFGYSRVELIGQSVDLLVPMSVRGTHGEHLKGYFRSPKPREMGVGLDLMAVRKDGSQFPVEISLSPLEGPDGVSVTAAIRDVTERKKVETRFRSLLDSAPDAMVIVNSDSIITLANTQSERLFGYLRTELVGQSVDILVPMSARGSHGERLKGYFRSPKPREMGAGLDLMAVRKDGSQFPVEISLSPLEGPDGGSVTAAIRDVTDRKKAEIRFRALLDSAPDAMVIVKNDGLIELANMRTEELFGYSRLELVGKSVDILVPEIREAVVGRDSPEFLAIPRPRMLLPSLDVQAVRKDGGEFPVEITLSPLEGPGGISVTAAIRDVTERKFAAQKLTEKMAELHQSNEALEQFAQIASHDLQEPLRMVASYTQLLSRRYKGRLDADADEFIDFAVDGTQRMKRLIEDLLLYSRAGKGGPPMTKFEAGDSLLEALSNLRAAIEESHAEVTSDPLPTLVAVESQLVQLLQNLIGNAIKYRGGRIPRIHVSAVLGDEKDSREWVFSVADNGIGIEPKYYDRIFQIFQRLHGRGEYEGTGIGLAICKRILQQQGGRIWLDSEPEQGSVFHFSLPMR